MKQRFTKRESFVSDDVNYFTTQGFSRFQAELMSSKGVTKKGLPFYVDKTPRFYSPYEMKNMAEAVAVVKKAMSEGAILVYGDYDADGLTATAILVRYFLSCGVDCDSVIPERKDGYGFHAKLAQAFVDAKKYALVITVDCGISDRDDIAEFLRQNNVAFVVTDHHELPLTLPECLCVNPKLGYPFKNLCGAGVAFKLVQALRGDDAVEFADLAAVGTIADMMPIEDENRCIVNFGLANLTNKGLKKLAETSYCSSPLTASDVAMRISPKINAAGRVSSPKEALNLLLATNSASSEAQNLLKLNDARKTLCDSVLDVCAKKFNEKDFYTDNLVYVYDDSFSVGVIGVAANNLRYTYNLPSVVLTRENGVYVGSARGVDGINMFELFSSVSNLLVKFGGHSGSVGFSVEEKNLLPLKTALSAKLRTFPDSLFDRSVFYDCDVDKSFAVGDYFRLADFFRPCLPSDEVVFRLSDTVKAIRVFGKDNAHLEIVTSYGLRLVAFSNFKDYFLPLKSGAEAEFLFTLDVDSFSGGVCGNVVDVKLNNSLHFDTLYEENLLKQADFSQIEFVDFDSVKTALGCDSVVAVFDSFGDFEAVKDKFDFDDFTLDFFVSSKCSKIVCISPLPNTDFSPFDKVVYFAADVKRRMPSETLTLKMPSTEMFANLSVDRQVCSLCFAALRRKNPFDSVDDCFDKYLLGKVSHTQFVLATAIFEELGLIFQKDCYNVEISGTRADLNDSHLFRLFAI